MKRVCFAAGVALSMTWACGDRGSSASERWERRAVPPGAFALVGDEVLSLEQLAGGDPKERLEFANSVVHDALLSLQARESTPHASNAVERGVLGRALLEELERQQLKKKPVSDEERSRSRKKHWMLFDRPRAVRVVEVFAPLSPLEDDSFAYEAMSVLREKSRTAANLEGFLEALSSVETDLKYRTTRLPPIARDGRVVPMLPQDHRYSEVPLELGEAAARLRHPGDVSEVFASGAGIHFLFAIEVVSELRPSDEEVREKQLKGIGAARLAPYLKKLRANRNTKVQHAKRDVGAFLRLVWRRK